MGIRSLLISKKFLISFAVNIIFLTLIGFLFSSSINSSIYSLKTWNNCESSYIAYDTREFDNNCYYYFGKNVSVNLSTGDSIRVNTDVYQFVNGKKYDNRSLLNQDNIKDGKYADLKANEIAIPESMSKKYNLNIGNHLYVFGTKEYTIQYVFRNLYDIKNPSIDSNGSVVFIGGETAITEFTYYAVFGNTNAVYNEVYTFSKAKSTFIGTTTVYCCLTAILSLIVELVIMFFFRKAEMKNLYVDWISGSKFNYCRSLIGVNMLIYFAPAMLSSTILAFTANYLSSIVIVSTALIFTITKMLVMRIKIH